MKNLRRKIFFLFRWEEKMRKQFFVMIGLVLTLSACAPPFSRSTLDKVDPQVSFQVLARDPESYIGKTVLFGGNIIEIYMESDQTWIEILQKPLDTQQKPQYTDVSYGRFFVHFPDFRDPAIYVPGREITIVGEVEGVRIQKIKEMDYAYPVIVPKESHLWQPQSMTGPFFNIGIGVGGVFR
jgi:outer membrane lipoprotein